MSENNIATLVPNKPDAELAEDFKQEVAKAYEPLIEVLDKYDAHGLNVLASVGKNVFGKFQIQQLTVIKTF